MLQPMSSTRNTKSPKRRSFRFSMALSICAVFPSAVTAQTFTDVPSDYWAYDFIETLVANAVTGGCGNAAYCPEDEVTRGQMAVFLERGMRGGSYSPPAASGTVFLDVAADDFAAGFIEQLFLDGITGGCGNNSYCPDQPVTRAQMAVFLLRSIHGAAYSPPPAAGIFDDVDLSYWAVHWIEALAAEGITTGCGNNNFCPEETVTRAQMAVFLVRAFELTKPGILSLFRQTRIIFNPTFEPVPLPYSSNATVTATVTGIPAPTTYTLDTFKLSAEGHAFTIANIAVTDVTGQVAPFISGISEGTEIAAASEVVFELVSPLTGGAQVHLEFSFEIAETGDTFAAFYTFTSN